MIRRGEGLVALDALNVLEGRKGKHRKLLRGILGNHSLRNVVAFSLEEQYPDDMSSGRTRSPGDFFQWIIEHKEEILAFIQTIIALFSTMDPKPTKKKRRVAKKASVKKKRRSRSFSSQLKLGLAVAVAMFAWLPLASAQIAVEPESPQPYKRIAAAVEVPSAPASATIHFEWQNDEKSEIEEFADGDEIRIWASPGEHWLLCRVTVIDWDARKFSTKISKARYVVGSSPVPPDPDPDPPGPDIVPGKKLLIIVRETEGKPAWVAAEVNSFRAGEGAKFLVERGHTLYVLDPDARDADGKRSGWLKLLDESKIEEPALYVLDPKTKEVIGATPLPKDASEAIKFITKMGG